MSLFKTHTTCRACDNTKLTKVFDLGVQPLANDFRGADGQCAGYAPLEVLFCEKCTLAQLSVVVDPKILYTNYAYETSKSQTMRLHFRALWDAIKEQSPVESVIEVGSNDGDFLEYCCKSSGASVVGIDAAENLAAIANKKGITTIVGPLDDYTADCAKRLAPKADVIVARHVFAHVDDWHNFILNLETMANQDTLIVIEVPYVRDTLERVEFDQCYHEHTSYLSLKAMALLLEPTSLRIHKVMRFPVHGGAIAIFIRHKDYGIAQDDSVNEFLNAENITAETWIKFASRARERIQNLATRVLAYTKVGKIVVGYGASAKSTVWISACKFTSKEISLIVDNTPQKQGNFSPGTNIAIVPESELTNEKADYAVLFSWNYASEIEAKNQKWVSGGGKFINPHE